MNRNSISYSIIAIFVYCLSLSFSLISHDHNDSHCQDDLLHCHSTFSALNNQESCSHENHFENPVEDCLLCDCTSVYDHVLSIHKTEFINVLFGCEIYQLPQKLYLKDFVSYSNKSPPLYS